MPNSSQKRNPLIRILAAIAWFAFIYVITAFLTGAIVGGMASYEVSSTGDIANAQAIGLQAALQFKEQYGLLVMAGQIALFSLLAFMGVLPGTTKYKKVRNTHDIE